MNNKVLKISNNMEGTMTSGNITERIRRLFGGRGAEKEYVKCADIEAWTGAGCEIVDLEEK